VTIRSDTEILGIIFPVLSTHLLRFFDGGKKVFVKFLAREATPAKLQPGSRLYFYESGSGKKIVGEAKVVKIESGKFDEVLARFREELFLTESELGTYAGQRRDKTMVVLTLEDVRKYAIPLALKQSVTMAGRYMTKAMMKELKANQG
jgi:hypothetical protein